MNSKQNLIRGIWIALAVICTGSFLYFFVNYIKGIAHFTAEIKELLAGWGNQEYIEEYIEILRKARTPYYIDLLLICVLYASFVVLVVQKLITLFRPAQTQVMIHKKAVIARVVYIAVTTICTAIMLYYSVSFVRTILSTAELSGNASLFVGDGVSVIVTTIIGFLLFCVLYASFAVLAVQKLITLFCPRIKNGEDVVRE